MGPGARLHPAIQRQSLSVPSRISVSAVAPGVRQVNARDLRSGLVRKRGKAVDKDARAAAEARNAERPLPVAPAAEAYAQALQVLLMARAPKACGCLYLNRRRRFCGDGEALLCQCPRQGKH